MGSLSEVRRIAAIALAGLAPALVAGCGDDATQEAATRTVTVERTVPAAAPPEPAATPAPEEQPRDDERAQEPADAAEEAGTIRVPDVVGEDHQLAQDTMQAAGLYNLSEEDATGQDRALLFDRNWTVVEQRPAAGEVVSADATIVLRSKKGTE